MYFRKTKPLSPKGRLWWSALPIRVIFVLKHDFLDNHRPEETETARRAITKKCGSPLRRSPCLGLSCAETSFRSLFLFPVFEDVIQCQINGSLQTLFHNSHNLCFKDGLFLFLLFLFVLLALCLRIFTSLIIFTLGISFASASALLASCLAS